MDTNLQFGLVMVASFLGALLTNTTTWFIAKDSDGIRNDFSFKKFIKSLGAAAFAAFGIAAAYQIKQIFGLPELVGAFMLGAGAQLANNKLRDI